MELDKLKHINAGFNKQLDLFKAGKLKSNEVLSLGKPLDILKAAGLYESEITLLQSVLSAKIKKHGLAVEELKGLAISIQKPIMVYEWGMKAKSIVIITEMERVNAERITVAIAAKRKGEALSVNNIASIHGKGVQIFLENMLNAKEGGLKESLRWVENEKALDWLAMAPPLGARQDNQELTSIANVIKNFKNPKLKRIFAVDRKRESP